MCWRSESSAVSPPCSRGNPATASKCASPASRCSAQTLPGSAKNTMGPTSGRCSNSARDRVASPHQVEIVGGAIDQFAAHRAFAGKTQASMRWFQQVVFAIIEAQAQAVALQQHQFAIHAGESGKRRVPFDFRDRQAPVPVIRAMRMVRMDLAGPAETVAPAFAMVFVGGNDPRVRFRGIHGESVATPAMEGAHIPALAQSKMCVMHRECIAGERPPRQVLLLQAHKKATRTARFQCDTGGIHPCRASCPFLRSLRLPTADPCTPWQGRWRPMCVSDSRRPSR